jgi:hypothetical protein
MAVHSDRLPTRLCGSLFGAGFGAVGAYAVWGAGLPGTDHPGRVLAYGSTAILIGVIALIASWTVADPDTIWCRLPQRRGRLRPPPVDEA